MTADLTVETNAKLGRLKARVGELPISVETLLPDLAFHGLIEDMIDAAETALVVLRGDRPRRAMPLVRIAFEASQRILALSAAEDFVNTGTRAWLYYQQKDRELRRQLWEPSNAETPEAWYASQVEQFTAIWEKHEPGARHRLQLASRQLDEFKTARGRSPDNFMGANLAEIAAKAYPVLSARGAGVDTGALQKLNKASYSALCRDSHTRVCLEPTAMTISGDGSVTIVKHVVKPEVNAAMALVSLSTSLSEVDLAVTYRLDQFHRKRAEVLAVEAAKAAPPTRNDYLPDMGIALARSSGGYSEHNFLQIPIKVFWIMPDGSVRTTLQTEWNGERHVATFDFPPGQTKDLIAQARLRQSELVSSAEPKKVVLDDPVSLTISARLVQAERNQHEAFIPFLVTKVR